MTELINGEVTHVSADTIVNKANSLNLYKNNDAIDRVIVVCFDDESHQLYQQLT